jgi:hypothetical protein
MARTAEKLSALVVKRLATTPGMHAVGDNLYLQVKNGGASWVLRYMLDQKARYMGLGSFRNWTLADARKRAREQRKLLDDGRDPLDVRDEIKKRERVDAACGTTFRECAAAYINAHRAGWRNKRHKSQWRTTLASRALTRSVDFQYARDVLFAQRTSVVALSVRKRSSMDNRVLTRRNRFR